MFQSTGEYEADYSQETGFHFYTFTPRPLMSGDFFAMDDELSAMLAKTHRQLGILEGMVQYLPDHEIVHDLMITRECCFSRLIDYNDGSFLTLFKATSLVKEEASHVQNIISAYKYSLGKSVSSITLSKICTIVLRGYDSDVSSKERDKAIFLGRSVTNLKEYNPTAPKKILPALADISAFLHNNEKTDILAKAALAHYQFEMIHPCECYNGVIGRMMISMILHGYGIQAASLICLSEYLYYNKNDYFEILRTTQSAADISR